MGFPKIYVSKPGVCFPEKQYTNADIIDEVKRQFNGDKETWHLIEGAVLKVFAKCNTQTRYLDFNPDSRLAGYAARASHLCLERNHVSIDDVDLVIFAGIAREYFEPATAMEVAATLGIKETHAFDVTTACVGHLEALQVAAAYMNMYDRYQTALICTAELTREFLDFNIQSPSDLYLKAAGLTIGNAAAALLLKREPFEGGSIQLIDTDTYSLPSHWKLCQVPIHGRFQSSSTELMRLHKYIAPRLAQVFERLGWGPNDVDHYVFHQPSEFMTRKILQEIGAETERGIYTHHLYGNNASATIGVVYDELLNTRPPKPGDKVMLGSAASGFTMVTASGVWVE